MRAIALIFMVVAVLWTVKIASAGCYPPAGPHRTDYDLGVTFHIYTEGSRLCIYTFSTAPKNGCTTCKSGYWHTCRSGHWKYKNTHFDKCSSQEAKPYINDVIQNDSPAGTDRANLLDGMLGGHIGAQDRLDKSNRALDKAMRVDKSRLEREALEEAQENLRRAQRNFLNETTRPEHRVSGSSGGTNDAARCAQLQEQLAQHLSSRRSDSSSGSHCDAAREVLGMLTYAKNNLARYECYRGEHDQDISNYQSYIYTNC